MARRTRRQTPEQIAAALAERRRKDFEAVSLQPESADLASNASVEIARQAEDREGKKVDHNVARRMDAFDALKPGMAPGCYDAARRFEQAIIARRGEGDKGRPTERIDRTAGLVTDAMLQAAEEVEAIVSSLPPRDWWLLMELIAPSRDLDGFVKVWVDENDRPHSTEPFFGWRAVVAFITGETHPHGQGATVRSACVNLRDAYLAWERRAAA